MLSPAPALPGMGFGLSCSSQGRCCPQAGTGSPAVPSRCCARLPAHPKKPTGDKTPSWAQSCGLRFIPGELELWGQLHPPPKARQGSAGPEEQSLSPEQPWGCYSGSVSAPEAPGRNFTPSQPCFEIKVCLDLLLGRF